MNQTLGKFRTQKPDIKEKIYNILLGLFISIIIITNIITGKYFKIGKFAMTSGIITYPLTFLITDIISELYGKDKANQTVWMGFFVSIFMMIIIYIANIIPTHINSPIKQNNFEKIFGLTPGIVIGSMIAYLVSQFSDVNIFHFIKKLTKGKYLWLRNNIATMASQVIDTLVFSITTWLIWTLSTKINEISFKLWAKIAIYELVAKCIFALCDTPILYISLYLIKQKLNKFKKLNS